MIVAGLTGGIATGKSTVAAVFAEAGAVVIDADRIAHDVIAPGKPARDRIAARFGQSVLLPDGTIDRQKLGAIIFNDPRQKAQLEAIVHPEVAAETGRRLAEIKRLQPRAVVILDVPLLIEAGLDRDLAELIVVYVPEDLQLERLMRRDRLTPTEALVRIRSQMPIEEKKKRATVVIDNSAAPECTREKVRAVFADLEQRSRRP
ncbi:MAG: dephospho-CoA kinase [Desulfobacterales bacterium]